jgi:hypothetical protein
MRATLITISLALALAAHAQVPTATQLTLEAPADMTQGQAVTMRATLTDAAGVPVAGEVVTFSTTLPFFDYVSTVKLGETRTNFRGEATLPFTPTVVGARRLTAEFAGGDSHAPARAFTPFTVAQGVLPPAPTPPAPVLPGLTRGRATAFLLPAMLGVWVIFAYALYQMTRIAREGRAAARAERAEAGD